jgi:hypothetical protein
LVMLFRIQPPKKEARPIAMLKNICESIRVLPYI